MQQENLIEIQNIDGITVVRFFNQNIGAASGIEQVSTQLSQYVLENSPQKVIVDFDGVKFFSSQALGMLIDIWRKMEKYDGKMVISGINPQLYRIFKITNLNKIFEFYDNLDLAIKSLN